MNERNKTNQAYKQTTMNNNKQANNSMMKRREKKQTKQNKINYLYIYHR